jgi:hypothetical protein
MTAQVAARGLGSPWLLAKFAHAAQRVIGQKGVMMLEKK